MKVDVGIHQHRSQSDAVPRAGLPHCKGHRVDRARLGQCSGRASEKGGVGWWGDCTRLIGLVDEAAYFDTNSRPRYAGCGRFSLFPVSKEARNVM